MKQCCPCRRSRLSKCVDFARLFTNSRACEDPPELTTAHQQKQRLTAGFWSAIIFPLALAACGGGSAEAPAPARQAVVLFVGDSTQAGAVAVGTPDPPSAVAGRLLPQAVMINEGLGGTSADQMLAGTDGSKVSWPVRLSRHSATVVTILHGINGDDTGAQHAAVLRQLVAEAQVQGIAVVLETPTPMIAGGIHVHDAKLPLFLERVQAVRQVAAEMHLTLCDHFAMVTAAGLDNLANIPDGVHPTLAVYKLMGEQDAGCLAPLVK